MNRRLALVLWILMWSLPAPPLARAAERLVTSATRASGPIHPDGVLEEPDWVRAVPIRDFKLSLVREGEAPTESTEVRILFDEHAIYFGVRVIYRTGDRVHASLTPRDQITDADHIAMHLDTYRDRHRAYIFGINPYGVQLDGILNGLEPDFSWDGVWDSAARRDAQGWTGEMAIPFRTLSFPAGDSSAWGLWIRHQFTGRNEIATWPLYRNADQGDVMRQAGDLIGLALPHRSGRLAIEPYAAAAASGARDAGAIAAGAPAPWTNESDQNVGGDLQYRITSTLVANATVNPDYSQVEADALQIDVNQRFPLFFAEKRPFFLEAAETFTTPINLVYTRRMANPDFGGKLTGHAGHLRVGAIALRDGGGGSQQGIGAGSSGSPTSPSAFAIARTDLDIGEHTSLGTLTTFHDIEDGARNLVVAVDGKSTIGKSIYASGQLARSETDGDAGDIGGDNAYLGRIYYDDGTTHFGVKQTWLGSRFRTDAGFLQRVGILESVSSLIYNLRPKGAARYRRLAPQITFGQVHDATGRPIEHTLEVGSDIDLHGNTFIYAAYLGIRERWLSRDYDQDRAYVYVENTRWHPLTVEFETELGDGVYYGSTDSASFKGWTEFYNLTLTARPAPQLTSKLNVKHLRFAHRAFEGEVLNEWLVGANTTMQFTRRLYARLYPRWDVKARHLDADVLLGYVVHPGTVLYLGASTGIDRLAAHEHFTRRGVFVKASYRVEL